MRKWKSDLVAEREKRSDNENGIAHLLFTILETCNIKKQHFHGSSMNGVSCHHLLDNLDIIFPEIEKVVLERLNCAKTSKTEK